MRWKHLYVTYSKVFEIATNAFNVRIRGVLREEGHITASMRFSSKELGCVCITLPLENKWYKNYT